MSYFTLNREISICSCKQRGDNITLSSSTMQVKSSSKASACTSAHSCIGIVKVTALAAPTQNQKVKISQGLIDHVLIGVPLG